MRKLLELKHVHKRYEMNNSESLHVLEDISFELYNNQILSILGPSGCGKSTLLRVLTGLESYESGTIKWGFNLNGNIPNVQMVFQEYSRSLYPWLNIQQQLMLAFSSVKEEKNIIKEKINHIAKITGLSAYMHLLPRQLSGGMQQRVALARALVVEPKILFLDEPFGSLDSQTRYGLEDYLLKIVKQLNISVIFVTHDLDEAVYISDRILVLTKRPAKLSNGFDVNLPNPRTQRNTKSLPEYANMRKQLYDIVS